MMRCTVAGQGFSKLYLTGSLWMPVTNWTAWTESTAKAPPLSRTAPFSMRALYLPVRVAHSLISASTPRMWAGLPENLIGLLSMSTGMVGSRLDSSCAVDSLVVIVAGLVAREPLPRVNA